ncbi:MAG: ABC transporter substrate-binding protein [Candidatus Obscuribacterales bacterium]|jgi:peptide/nickel transport system substrate-binding protein|nr:ABC transporter substrate-binding protein [Candidatus Obscuribacterales bacterium]
MLRNAIVAAMLFSLSACITTVPPKKLLAERNSVPPTEHKAGGQALFTDFQVVGDMRVPIPANPGPFKLVEIENEDHSKTECWEARGDLGEFGGNITLTGFGGGPKTYNNWQASDVESHGLSLLLWDALVFPDPWTGEPTPKLAKTVTQSPDGLSYTITLRKGLKWSDGKPITADDVYFTFTELIAKGFGNSSSRDTLSVNGKFPKVEKVDELSCKFTTAQPFAPFLSSLYSIAIAPKHAMEPITKRPMKEFSAFWDINCDPKSMVTSGPFKVERYVPGQRIELERNPNYHMVDKRGRRLPYLDEFTYAICPDQTTEILKFYGREIDLLDIRHVRGFDAALMHQRADAEGFKMYNLGADDGTMFLMFNLCMRKDPKTGKSYVNPIKQKWFNNRNFRQAVSHAISRKRIVDNVLRGVGMPLYTSETPASIFFNKDLKPFPQDLKYSSQLLREGGFVFKDEKLFDAEGHRVEFTLNTNSGNMLRDAVCVMIAQDLKELGMKVNYQPIEFNILIDKVETSLDWDAIVMGLSGDRFEPYGGANVWKSDGRLHMFDQRLPDEKGTVHADDARPWEKEIDRLFDQGATTIDQKERHKIFNRFQEIAYEEAPFIYLYCPLLITAMYDYIGNYKPTPWCIIYTPKGSLHNIEEIYRKGKDKK